MIAMESKDRYIHIYRGQALYGLKRYQESLDAFDQVKDLSDSIVSIGLIRCRSYWLLEKWEMAWQEVHKNLAKPSFDFRFVKLKLQWLLEKELQQQAYEFIVSKIEDGRIGLNDKVSLAAALRSQNLIPESIKVLELLRLTEPHNPDLAVQLAYSYLKLDQGLVAAQLFHQASLQRESSSSKPQSFIAGLVGFKQP